MRLKEQSNFTSREEKHGQALMRKELRFHRNPIRLAAEHLLVQRCLASAFSFNRAVAERAEKQLFLELERINWSL